MTPDNNDFAETVKSISALFSKYSAEDVTASLFVSNLWLPNAASPIKHTLYACIFASKEPTDFLPKRIINSYEDFLKFLNQLYSITPSFPSLEDCVPEPDWGEVNFYLDGHRYPIFYGAELSNVYDYLSLFEILHLPFDKEYEALTGLSPRQELHEILKLQESIITKIRSQVLQNDLKIIPGHIETPSEGFWSEAIQFLHNYSPTSLLSPSTLKRFSLKPGTLPKESLLLDRFADMFFSGELLPACLIAVGESYIPLIPRRHFTVLFEAWGKLFRRYQKTLSHGQKSSMTEIQGCFYGYAKQRISKNALFPFVSARKSENSSHDVIFPFAVKSKDKLVVFHVLPPMSDGEEISAEVDRISPKITEALDFLSKSPTQLILHGQSQRVEFRTDKTEYALKPIVFIVIPQTSSGATPIGLSVEPPGEIIFMDAALAIIDSLENADELSDFIDYLEENKSVMRFQMASLLDQFGTFKATHGVLVNGAIQPHWIMIDPHSGDDFRYKSLAQFWKDFPTKDFFGHPRSWEVSRESPSRTRLISRSYFGCALYSKIGNVHAYFNAPFDYMSPEEGRVANFLMECAEDVMTHNANVFASHIAFRDNSQIQVMFLHDALLQNEHFKHLRHLAPGSKLWRIDAGYPTEDLPAIRIVFSGEAILKSFSESTDRSPEVALGLVILDALDSLVPDPNIAQLRELLFPWKAGKPRFTFFITDKIASFPENIPTTLPLPKHFKKVKKRMAELAQTIGVTEGEYALREGEKKLNSLRKAMVSEIDTIIRRHNFAKDIPFLLAKTDALVDDYEKHCLGLQHSMEHEVDYSREVAYAKEESKHLAMHRNYRYLIEKFVQIQPQGTEELDSEQLGLLLALADWLFVIYSASDSLHYGILPVSVSIDRDLLIDVKYQSDVAEKEKLFAEEQGRLNLGLIGEKGDTLRRTTPIQDYILKLDEAWRKDLRFGFHNLVNVLQVLSHWPGYCLTAKEAPFYSATEGEIISVCIKSIKDTIQADEIKTIIDFLLLKKDAVIQIIGFQGQCDDIPVWEYFKRPARYNIRPIIQIGDTIYWGPHSTRRAGLIWSGTLSSARLPADIGGANIAALLEVEKSDLDDTLNTKAHEIIRRHTQHAEPNVDLANRDKSAGHPGDLGDYDVLAYIPNSHVILNIECKNLSKVFCLKDAKRLRETIFGEPGKDEGHFRQIRRRQKYLEEHWEAVAKLMRWPLTSTTPPKILPVYVTSTAYWWTRFPPYEVPTQFIQINLLSEFIKGLLDVKP